MWFMRKETTPEPERRSGLLKGSAVGDGLLNEGMKYSWVAEVKELDRIGHLSKLKFLSVTGVDKDVFLHFMPEWVPTEDVIWRDDPTVTNNPTTATKGEV